MSSGERKSTIETLAERADRAADRVKAAAAKNRAALEQQVKDVDTAAKDKAARVVQDAVDVEQGGVRRWNEIQNVPRHTHELSSFLIRSYVQARASQR